MKRSTAEFDVAAESDLTALPTEPERYELYENSSAVSTAWDVTRRDFFRVTGGGIIVALLLRDAMAQEPAGRGRGNRGGGQGTPQEIGAWLHIGEDSLITVYTGKVEIGQNV